MKKIFIIPFIISILIFTVSGCSSGDGLSLPADQLELLPENFPIDSCPFYYSEEIVSVTSKGSDSYFSYEIIFNSDAEYSEIVDFYSRSFPAAITKDFGIAYNLLSVPSSSGGYMCNFNIYSDITHGEKGKCTVIVTVSEY